MAFKEVVAKVIRDFYKKDFDVSDIRSSIISAVSVKIEEPVFESLRAVFEDRESEERVRESFNVGGGAEHGVCPGARTLGGE